MEHQTHECLPHILLDLSAVLRKSAALPHKHVFLKAHGRLEISKGLESVDYEQRINDL